MTSGIHLVHKPVGATSFSVVRDLLGSAAPAAAATAAASAAAAAGRHRRVCHGGALDPFASGLLLILVEPATKLFDYLHAIPKAYDATVRWGIETDNGDPHGRAVFEGDPSSLSPAQLDDLLAPFIGWHDQTPPATSNKRIAGERAYVRAHRGEAVELPPSRVYLHEARWLGHDLPRSSRLRVVVRGGYYVRALARDLGRRLRCGAHLASLHRSAIGPWRDPGPGGHVEVRGRAVLPWAELRMLSDQEVGELRQHRTIPAGELLPPDWRLPPGFPDPDAPIRGFHLGRFAFLLRRVEDNRLGVITALAGEM